MPAVVFEFDEKGAAAVLKALKDQGIAAEATSKKIEAARQRETKAEEKAATALINSQKKKEQAVRASLDKIEKENNKSIQKQQKAENKAIEDSIKKAEEAAKKKAAAEVRAIDAADKRAKNSLLSSAGVKGASGGIGSVLGYAIGGLISSVASAAMSAAINAVRANIKLNETANRISITAHKTGGSFSSANDIAKDLQSAAVGAPGQSSAELGAGLQKFVEGSGGNLQMGRALLPTIATTANATGANPEQLGSALASLGREFKLTDVTQYQQMIAQINEAAKNSGESFETMVGQLQNSGDAAERFNLSVKDMAALTSIAGKGGGNFTTVQRALGKIESNETKLAAQGIFTRNKQGQPREIRDVLFDMITKTGGNGPEILKKQGLEKFFGSKGMAAIQVPFGAYETAYQAAGGDKNASAARKAGEEALKRALDEAFISTSDYSQIQQEAGQRELDVSARYQQNMEALNAALSGPSLTAMNILSEAAVAAAYGLELIKDKTNKEKADTAQEQLDAFRQQHAGELMGNGKLNQTQQKEYDRLQREVQVTSAAYKDERNVAENPKAFEQRLLDLDEASGEKDAWYDPKGFHEKLAKGRVAKALEVMNDPTGESGTLDDIIGLSDKQKDLIEKRLAEQTRQTPSPVSPNIEAWAPQPSPVAPTKENMDASKAETQISTAGAKFNKQVNQAGSALIQQIKNAKFTNNRNDPKE